MLDYLISSELSSCKPIKTIVLIPVTLNAGEIVARLLPLFFLVFSVPVPAALKERAISALAVASTGITRVLFEAYGVPFVQGGAVFFMPGFDIKVALDCIGILSSIARLMTTLPVG